MRDLGEWRPGFYSEFRYESNEHSGLAWGAILRKVLVLTLIPRSPCSFFREQVPKMDSFADVAIRKELGDTYKYIFPGSRVPRLIEIQYFQDSGFLEWVGSSISRIQGSQNVLRSSISRIQGP